MKKGGYKIIDFKGTTLSGTAVEILGIFNQIVDDYNKPILVSGVSLSGELKDDSYAGVLEKTVSSSKIVELTVYGGVITVTEDDEVTFTSAKNNVELTADMSNVLENAVMKTNASTLQNDLNEASNGWAYYGSSATNKPVSGSDTTFFVLTLIHLSYKAQLAINRGTGDLYTRSFSAGSWQEWKLASNV